MAIDSYSICSGGCGKKIRFCCGKDVVADFNKVITAIEGEQRLTALDKCNAAIDKHGFKACFASLKIDVQMQLGEVDQAKETMLEFRKAFPNNPVGLALSSLFLLGDETEESLEKAVEHLQRSVENAGEAEPPLAMVDAIRGVGLSLFRQGRLTAARAHLSLFNSFLPEPDPQISNLILKTVSDDRIPLLLRQDYQLEACKEETEWKTEFNEIIQNASAGRWLKSIEELTDLDKKFPNQAAIARAIAILESRLGNASEMAAAWSQFADTDGVELDQAVEAEAISQLVDPTIEKGTLPVLIDEYEVTDVDGFTQQVAAVDQFVLIERKFPSRDPESPPPKSAFLILDRKSPETGVGIKVDEIPTIDSQMLYYGRETDRQARIEVIIAKNADYDEKTERLKTLLDGFIDKEVKNSEAVDHISELDNQLGWQWRFPDDTPPDHRQALIEKQRETIILEKWPDIPLAELDGETPRSCIGKDYYKIPILGAILLLELAESATRSEFFDCNPLREVLELPPRESIDPATVDGIEKLTLSQLDKLDVEKLEDKDLLAVFNFTGLCSSTIALKRSAIEITKRDFGEDSPVELPYVYGILARLEQDTDTAISYIRTARDMTIKAGESPGILLVNELEILMERGRSDECASLFREIETRYMQDPAVSNEMMRVLMKFGIIGPDGRPQGSFAQDAGGSEGQLVGTETESEDSGKLWTPDGGDSGGGSGESKLWVPD